MRTSRGFFRGSSIKKLLVTATIRVKMTVMFVNTWTMMTVNNMVPIVKRPNSMMRKAMMMLKTKMRLNINVHVAIFPGMFKREISGTRW